MAGNGGEMAELRHVRKAGETSSATGGTEEKRRREKKTVEVRKGTDRAESSTADAKEKKKQKRRATGNGAARLKRMLDRKVAENMEELAALLTEKALGGDIATTRLLLTLAEEGKPAPVRRRGRGRRKFKAMIERWANGPQWQGSSG